MKVVVIVSHYASVDVATKETNGISMSTVYAVLLTLYVVLILLELISDGRIHGSFQIYTELLVLTFSGDLYQWTASKPSTTFMIQEGHRIFKEWELLQKSVLAVLLMAPSYKHVQARLDRPNAHQLLKLYTNSVHLFEHVHSYSEIKFEPSYQELNSVLSKRTDGHRHIELVYEALFQDWLHQVYEIWVIFSKKRSGVTDHALKSFQFFVFELVLSVDITAWK